MKNVKRNEISFILESKLAAKAPYSKEISSNFYDFQYQNILNFSNLTSDFYYNKFFKYTLKKFQYFY